MSYTLTPLTAGPIGSVIPTATSSTGSVILSAIPNEYLYVSTNSGATWDARLDDTIRVWLDVTVSANGAKMCAADNNGDPWVSTDSGENWTQRTIPDNSSTRACAYTRNGVNLFVVAGADKLFQSTNDGVSWTQIFTGSTTIASIAVSDAGTKVLVSYGGSGYGVAVGTYSGSWSFSTGLFLQTFQNTCLMSGDGTKMILPRNSTSLVYSIDGGASFLSSSGTLASVTLYDVAISQDGSRIIAISSSNLYTATDVTSTSWSSQAIPGSPIFIAGSSSLNKIYIPMQGDYILTGELPAPPPVICFRDGSKILTFNPATGREEYTAVENIRPGTLVKTRMSGYVPVCMVGTSTVTIPNDAERTADRLYVCSKDQFPELTEDLYITGHHSILVNNMTDAEREECAEEMGRVYLTEGRCRLPAHISRRTRVYEAPGAVERIWHFALEHNDEQMNYGVYANGLLVESCSIWRLRTMVGYELLVGNVYTLSNTVSAPPASLPIVC